MNLQTIQTLKLMLKAADNAHEMADYCANHANPEGAIESLAESNGYLIAVLRQLVANLEKDATGAAIPNNPGQAGQIDDGSQDDLELGDAGQGGGV